jgi:hypothetical protein
LHFVNECRLADIFGVAVALDGAPLMRLFKRAARADAPEDEAAATRLLAVAQRGKVETSRYPSRDAAAEPPPPQRRFGLPQEASTAKRRA